VFRVGFVGGRRGCAHSSCGVPTFRGREVMSPSGMMRWFDSSSPTPNAVFRQGAALTQVRGHESAPPEKTSVLGLSAGPLGSRYEPPVLTPHAPSTKGPAIYRGPERGQNPPAMFAGARGSSSSTLRWPTVAIRSASRPQVGGLASDRPSAGQCPLVKARETVRRPVRVGRFHGVGVARPEESGLTVSH
jgi:hypothetical protein